MARKPLCGGCGDCARCERAAYMREWYRRPGRAQAQRESQLASRQRRLEVIREYDRQRGSRVYDSQKVKVRSLVAEALKRGRLTREPCEVCGETAEAHHDDYAKPLAVRWLCRRHHGEVHRVVV